MTHYAVAILAVYVLSFGNHTANLLGFMVAFCVSYTGQSNWTFNDRKTKSPTLLRYFLTAVSGFCLNDVVLYFGLHLGMDYRIALLLAIVLAAAFSYLISLLWVFKNE